MSESQLIIAGETSELVIEDEGVTSLSIVGDSEVLEIDMGTTGPQGPPGADGADGADASSYTHTQASASSTWTIAHNLGWRPTITVLSAGGVQMIAEVVHLSTNTAQVLFVEPTTGSARCT